MISARAVHLFLGALVFAAACGKSETRQESSPAPVAGDAAPAATDAALDLDAPAITDAAEPTADAAVAGAELWLDPEDTDLVNPLEWNGVTLTLLVTERADDMIRGKLTATHDAMTMDVATWEVDATLGHWVHVATKGKEAALRFGWAMDLSTKPAGEGAENFVELVHDKKHDTVVAKRKWSGTRLDKPPAWAKGYVEPI